MKKNIIIALISVILIISLTLNYIYSTQDAPYYEDTLGKYGSLVSAQEGLIKNHATRADFLGQAYNFCVSGDQATADSIIKQTENIEKGLANLNKSYDLSVKELNEKLNN